MFAKFIALITSFILFFSGTASQTVGVLMPSAEGSDRWVREGSLMADGLSEKGYETILVNAEGSAETQIRQIEEMIEAGVDALIIAPLDGEALTDVLEKAAAAGIKIINYDRLIYDTPNIEVFCGVDNFEVGYLQASYIAEALDLADEENDEIYNIEIFAGSSDDPNAYEVYDGLMSILGEYIESGKLNVLSSEIEFDDVSVYGWLKDTAYDRMMRILGEYYADEKLDAVLACNDSIASGIIAAVEESGFDYPILTGQDGDEAAVANIIDGKQSMTIYKNSEIFAANAVDITDKILSGQDLGLTGYVDNGAIEVPVLLNELTVIDINNVEIVK